VRFYGAVGYTESQETTPGVWTDVITEKHYYGDVIRDQRRLESAQGHVNEDIRIDNSIVIVADAYAMENILKMRYIMWNGYPWAITNVEVRHPRLILQIGAQWDGITA
jgi:hypothetical protein